MFKIIHTTLLFVSLLASLGLGAQNFEGTVVLKQTTPDDEVTTITWYIRGNQISMETFMHTQKGDYWFLAVPDLKTGKLFIHSRANDGESTYEIAVDNIQGAATGSKLYVTKGANFDDPKTGKGVEMTIANASYTTHSKISLDIPIDFSLYAAYFKDDFAIQSMAITHQPGLPIESETRDLSGNFLKRYELVSINPGKVPNEKFLGK